MISSFPSTWERSLLSLAYEAGRSAAARPLAAPSRAKPDSALLARAYAHCDSITSRHSKTFFAASSLLPVEKRNSIRALYAFCRVSDNIVDCSTGDVTQALATWRRRSLSTRPPREDWVGIAWTDTRLHYGIPTRYAEQLIEGVGRDLTQTRYRTFEELTAYAYGVASTVGLMSMHILGYSGAEAIPFAVKLGVALQLTNILRDVGEDWMAGRVYLPQSELAAFGLDETDIAAGRVDERWRELMRFQIARNRRLYAEALPGVKMLHRDGRLAVQAAGELYRAILDDIEAHDYDVFSRRAHVSTPRKLSMLPMIWARSR